ncbi:MAG: hypothetical protein ACR2RV_20215 [Verrucomicrobiales bacterium]
MEESRRRAISLLVSTLLVGAITSDSVHAQSTFAGVSFIDGELSDEYSLVTEWVSGEPLPTSTIEEQSFNGNSLTEIATGSASAEVGTLRARATGFSNTPITLSVAGFTDTITIFADGEGGQSGTLHLEYELDGTVFVKGGSFGSISLDLLNQDLPELENLDDPLALEGADTYDSYAETFIDIIEFSDLSQTYVKGVNPLVVSLDIPINFGTPINYGAALFLLMYGEGDLDFSNTLEFSDAVVTNAIGEEVIGAGVASNSGIAYGGLNAVPEPHSSMLVLTAITIGLCRRRR